MKNSGILFFIALLFWNVSCKMQDTKWEQPKLSPNYLITLEFDCASPSQSETQLDSARRVIERRLATGHIYYRSISAQPERSRLHLELIGLKKFGEKPNNESLAILTVLLMSPGILEFWDTYSPADSAISNTIIPMLSKDSMGQYLFLNIYPKSSVLGYIQREHISNFTQWFVSRKASAALPADLDLAFSLKPDVSDQSGRYTCYLLKKQTTVAGPFLTGAHLISAESRLDQNTGEALVQLSFDQPGSKILADKTKQAAEKGNREIAILLNGGVLSAPRVMNPVLGGHASVSGNFTPAEANNLAGALQSGVLPCPAKVTQAQLTSTGAQQ